MKNFLSRNTVSYAYIILSALVTLICIYTPELELLERLSDFTVHIMLGFLFISMFFLLYDQRRLMFTSLVACMALCLFLKEASNNSLALPEEASGSGFTIAHINVSDAIGTIESFLAMIQSKNADIISFQEVTPEWSSLLSDYFNPSYPYRHSMTRIDPYGMAIFSRIPIDQVDTIYYAHIPNLKISFSKELEKPMCLISSYLIPPKYREVEISVKNHLQKLSDEIQNCNNAVISLGDFNMTYWSHEIRNFRRNAKLENSRRDISASGLKIPYEHIFYGSELECTKFEEIRNDQLDQFGIVGTYQFKDFTLLSELLR